MVIRKYCGQKNLQFSKLERFLPNQHTQSKWLNFENWCSGEVSKCAKIWLSKSIFYVKNLGTHFLLLTFFDTSPLTQFSNFNNFLWVCWFLGKNLSYFVPPTWKLHNLYCHSRQLQFSSQTSSENSKNVVYLSGQPPPAHQ